MGIIGFIYVLCAIILIATVIILVLNKMKEKDVAEGRRPERTQSKATSKPSATQLLDTREFIKDIEDIKDGILITENSTRFIAALTCFGVGDFYDQSAIEQMRVMKGYLGFINTINSPITYRLYTKELDMDYTVKKYSEKREEFIQKYKYLEASLSGIPKERLEEKERVQKEMDSLRFRIEHLTDQIHAVEHFSSSAVAMEQVQNYVIEWKYRAFEFDTDLTPAERFVRAKEELDVIAMSKIAALSAAGVKARICTQNEMIDICRRVSQPISVERFRMKELENSSFFDDINTSESIKNMDLLVGQEFARSVREELYKTLQSGSMEMPEEMNEEPEKTEGMAEKPESKEDSEGEVFTFGSEE